MKICHGNFVTYNTYLNLGKPPNVLLVRMGTTFMCAAKKMFCSMRLEGKRTTTNIPANAPKKSGEPRGRVNGYSSTLLREQWGPLVERLRGWLLQWVFCQQVDVKQWATLQSSSAAVRQMTSLIVRTCSDSEDSKNTAQSTDSSAIIHGLYYFIIVLQ